MTALTDLHPEYILDEHGKKKAVILSIDTLTALLERLNHYENEEAAEDEMDAKAAEAVLAKNHHGPYKTLDQVMQELDMEDAA